MDKKGRRRLKFPRAISPLVDQDYRAKLSPEDLAYLDKFNDEFYGASFKADPLHVNVETQRSLGVDKNCRNEDLFGKGLRAADSFTGTLAEEQDWASAPDSPEYRSALSRYRAQIPRDRRKKTAITPEFLEAQAALYELTGAKTREPITEGLVEKAVDNSKKIARLKKAREVVFNIGSTVAKHEFRGDESYAVKEMMDWLESVHGKLVDKLNALGVTHEDLGLKRKEESK